MHSVLVWTSPYPKYAEKSSTTSSLLGYQQQLYFSSGRHPYIQGKAAELPCLLYRYLMLMLRALHCVSGKLLFCSQTRICVWRGVTAQMIPDLEDVFPFQLRHILSLAGETFFEETSSWITGLQLPSDCLYGKASSITLVNSCSTVWVGWECHWCQIHLYRPELVDLWCWSTWPH